MDVNDNKAGLWLVSSLYSGGGRFYGDLDVTFNLWYIYASLPPPLQGLSYNYRD